MGILKKSLTSAKQDIVLEISINSLLWNYICNYRARSLRYIHFEDAEEYHILVLDRLENIKEYLS